MTSSLRALAPALLSQPPQAKLPPREMDLVAEFRRVVTEGRTLPTHDQCQALLSALDARTESLKRTVSVNRSLKAANDELHVALAVVAFPECAEETELRGRLES